MQNRGRHSEKAKEIDRLSPVAWQHLSFIGKYEFYRQEKPIDIKSVVRFLREIEGLTLVQLPSYSPEFNPVERYFEEIRRVTANRVFESLTQQAALITEAVIAWSEAKKLIGYKWILE